MPVVIGEIEVETVPAEAATPPPPATTPAKPIDPAEIAYAMRHEAERMLRVRAD